MGEKLCLLNGEAEYLFGLEYLVGHFW